MPTPQGIHRQKHVYCWPLTLGDRVITSAHAKEERMTHIYVIHENAAWLEPLAAALDRQALPWRDWVLGRGGFDLSRPSPEGAFYHPMRASSPPRDPRLAPALTASAPARAGQHH